MSSLPLKIEKCNNKSTLIGRLIEFNQWPYKIMGGDKDRRSAGPEVVSRRLQLKGKSRTFCNCRNRHCFFKINLNLKNY